MDGDLLSRDRTLLDLFRAGEQRALEVVFLHYERLVRSIVVRGFGEFRGLRREADVEDVVASVFITAFEEQTRLRYDGLKPYHAFLSGITRNTVRTWGRKHAREIPAEVPEEASQPEADPEQVVAGAEERAMLERFRSCLGDDLLVQVFEGYFGGGCSEQELADRLGRSRYRIRLCLARIRRRMKAFLREEGL